MQYWLKMVNLNEFSQNKLRSASDHKPSVKAVHQMGARLS